MTHNICPKCRERQRKPGNTYCRECRNEITRQRMRKHRAKYSELSEPERRRAICRSYTNVLLRRGKLVRHPCAVCGSVKSENHHVDYSNPRNIRRLCRRCHIAEHREEP